MEGPDKFHTLRRDRVPEFRAGVACFSVGVNRRRLPRGGAGEVETIMVDAGDATK